MAKMSGSQLLAAFLLVSFILPALAETSDVSAASPVTPSSSPPVTSSSPPVTPSSSPPVTPSSSPPVTPSSSPVGSGVTMAPASISSPASPVKTPTAGGITSSSSTPPLVAGSVSSASSAAPDCSLPTIKAQRDICPTAPNKTCTPNCRAAYEKVKSCGGDDVAHMRAICNAAVSISASLIMAAFFAVLTTSLVHRLD